MKKLMVLILLVLLTGCQKEEVTVVLNPGYDIVGINTEWTDEGCSILIDNELQKVMTVSSNDIDLTALGEYNVVYEKEYEKEVYTCLRVVKVVDHIPPVVVLNGGIDTIILGEEWIDAGATATDNIDTELTIEVTGTVDTNTLGSYEIFYITRDDAQNTTVIKRIVNVIEQGE